MVAYKKAYFIYLTIMLSVPAFLLLSHKVSAEENSQIERGKYILQATGGCSCHIDPENPKEELAGGRPLITPYGAIFSSNITPDKLSGIGSWTDDDFVKAIREGVRPNGDHLFPIFPYTTFTGMKRADIIDLKRYLDSKQPISKTNKDNDMWPPFGWRFNLSFWKLMNFEVKEFKSSPNQNDTWNRGAYLVESMAHCRECHTPRNFLGALKEDLLYAGSVDGPEGELAPNITSDQTTGIGNWQLNDLSWFLQTGQKPDGDITEGLMNEVIEQGYQFLTDADLKAISVYIKDLPATNRKVAAQKK